MPQHHMVIPHYMGNGGEVNVRNKEQVQNLKDAKNRRSFPSSTSYQDIPLLLPQEPDGLEAAKEREKYVLDNSCGLLDNRNRANQNQPFPLRRIKVEHPIQDMQMKGFVDDLGSSQPERGSHYDVIAPPQNMDEWWETQERGDQVVSADEARQVGPRTQCRCQVGVIELA